MRFKVVYESPTAHCCFEAAVIDTERPNPPGYASPHYVVCECFDDWHAEKIAEAMNEVYSPPPDEPKEKA